MSTDYDAEMAQAVRRLGGEVVLVHGSAHVLSGRRSARSCAATGSS